MKFERVTIYPIDNTYILEATNLLGNGPVLRMSFKTPEEVFTFAKEHMATTDDVKAEREMIWHPNSNVIPDSVMSGKDDPMPGPDRKPVRGPDW